MVSNGVNFDSGGELLIPPSTANSVITRVPLFLVRAGGGGADGLRHQSVSHCTSGGCLFACEYRSSPSASTAATGFSASSARPPELQPVTQRPLSCTHLFSAKPCDTVSVHWQLPVEEFGAVTTRVLFKIPC